MSALADALTFAGPPVIGYYTPRISPTHAMDRLHLKEAQRCNWLRHLGGILSHRRSRKNGIALRGGGNSSQEGLH